MSEIRHRFFKITSGPFVDRFMELRKIREDAARVIRAFMVEVGASNCVGTSPATYQFDFKDARKVDMQAWAKTKPRRGEYFFRPRRGTATGKALALRIKQLPESANLSDALELTGLDYGFPVVFSGSYGYRPFIKFYSVDVPVFIVSVPWIDYPAKELAKYRKDRAARRHYSANLDHALWEPPEWMAEIKEWEALKLIDELSADGAKRRKA